MLKGKKIILGICGSIAAYKSAFLTRLLIKSGANVQVIMTEAAKDFITPLTLATLSERPVHSEVSSGDAWNNHVELGLWADAMLIAPMTATTLGKLANGICDSMLAAVYLSAKCPVFFAPAMDLDMWRHPATQNNVARLHSYGNHLIPVGYGELASGLVGEGRLAEPEEIIAQLGNFFQQKTDLEGKRFLLTAGPTHEAIDPVRFIGNRSSGKMGVAIAEGLANRGAAVELILGPSQLSPTHERINLHRVESAAQMYELAITHFPNCDGGVLAAAVADYRPKTIADQKIKKQGAAMTLELERTKDIAQALGQVKQSNQILVGFALETNNELANAHSKLIRKNFDFIVLNSLRDQGAGFAHDTNKITILHRDERTLSFDLKSKMAVAQDIVGEMVQLFKNK
ncbi:MAG: bifunctional phosphopantothenoylcysteine decarboxylase/phosphopantothenate--cysteine ligase CoaBC [Bacteroidota bacterium]